MLRGLFLIAFVAATSILSAAERDEDAFYDLLARLDSPTLAERDRATVELAERYERYRRFVPDVKDIAAARLFSPEASWRIMLARTRYRDERVRSLDSRFTAKTQSVRLKPQVSPTDRPVVFLRLALAMPDDVVPIRQALETGDILFHDRHGRAWRSVLRGSSVEFYPEETGGASEMTLNMTTDGGPETTVPEFHAGTVALSVLVGLDVRPFLFPDLFGEPLPRTLATERMTLTLLQRERSNNTANNTLSVTIRVEYDPAYDSFESHRDWILRRPFRLVVDGRDYNPIEVRQESRTGRGATLTLVFPVPETKKSQPVALRCELPGEILQRRVKIDVADRKHTGST